MINISGFLKLHRKFIEWEWYGNKNTKIIFIHCLLKANWKDGKFQGEVVPRGSFASSIQKIADETHLTIQQTRTAINNLKATNEITSKGHTKYSVFTVINYDKYQDANKQNNEQSTDNQQEHQHSDNIQITTIEELKKERTKDTPPLPPSNEGGDSESETNAKKPNVLPKLEQLENDFEIIYKDYPNKKGKTGAFKPYVSWLKGRKVNGRIIKLNNRQIWLAVKNYVEQMDKSGSDCWLYFSTLMGNTLLDYVGKEE